MIEFGKNSDKLDTMRSVISSVSLLLLFINYSAASKDDGKVDIDLGEMLQMGKLFFNYSYTPPSRTLLNASRAVVTVIF